MSNEKDALSAMLAQYETNNKPKGESKTSNVYDLKNYFTTYIKDGIKTATKTIRILPTADGSSPFVQFYGHKIKVDGETKTFPCLKHEKNEPCPFCETRELLYSTGKETDKELAKNYNARLMYIVKVIDRDNEQDGVKFWRFAHDYRKEGIYDKIIGVLNAIKKDVTHPETGRDLVLTINRNQNNIPIVSAVASLDATPLSEDETKKAEWLANTTTWDKVYAVKNYNYLEIIVKGGIPVWDKEANCYVDKASIAKADANKTMESELTIGVETVKNNIVASTTQSEPVVQDESDDLPF
jgi:hypothetical protein